MVEGGLADVELNPCCVGVEDRVVGLGWVRDKVVVVEVGDECVEF